MPIAQAGHPFVDPHLRLQVTTAVSSIHSRKSPSFLYGGSSRPDLNWELSREFFLDSVPSSFLLCFRDLPRGQCEPEGGCRRFRISLPPRETLRGMSMKIFEAGAFVLFAPLGLYTSFTHGA